MINLSTFISLVKANHWSVPDLNHNGIAGDPGDIEIIYKRLNGKIEDFNHDGVIDSKDIEYAVTHNISAITKAFLSPAAYDAVGNAELGSDLAIQRFNRVIEQSRQSGIYNGITDNYSANRFGWRMMLDSLLIKGYSLPYAQATAGLIARNKYGVKR